jgi:transposase
MPGTIAQSVGVDIAQDPLEAHLHPAGRVRRFAHDAKGWATPIAWLGGGASTRVAFEPSGADHRAFARRLAAAGLPRPTPSTPPCWPAARRCSSPPVRPVVSATLDAMKALQGARRARVEDRVAARNRGHDAPLAVAQAQARARLAQIDRQIAAIDAALHTRLAAAPAVQDRFEILVSIPGVGAATAFALLVAMPELGALEHKCAARLAGRAPVARDSGQHRGRRCIRGGRVLGVRPSTCRPGRGPLRCRDDGQVPGSARRRQAAQSRPRRDHA